MLPKNNKLLSNAKKLRAGMTKQERHLWYDFLKTYPVKIYKQRIIGNYIVDFYCASANLVIELDGGQHYTDDGINSDKSRDEHLRSLGLTVLRISNLDVDNNFEGVCDFLDMKIKENM